MWGYLLRQIQSCNWTQKTFEELRCNVISCDQAVKTEITSKNLKKWQKNCHFCHIFESFTAWLQHLTLKPDCIKNLWNFWDHSKVQICLNSEMGKILFKWLWVLFKKAWKAKSEKVHSFQIQICKKALIVWIFVNQQVGNLKFGNPNFEICL